MQNVKIFKAAMLILAMIACLVVACVASAQSPELKRHMQINTVQVTNWQGNEGPAGTGVVVKVGNARYVVTNHHVACDPRVGRLEITYHDGQRGPCEVVNADKTMDVCVLRPLGNIKIGAEMAPYDGSLCYLSGHGGGSLEFKPMAKLGPIQFADHPFPVTQFHGDCESGDSGSGLFNERGQVVGVIRGKLRDGLSTGITGQAFHRHFEQQTGQWSGGIFMQRQCAPCQTNQCPPGMICRPAQPQVATAPPMRTYAPPAAATPPVATCECKGEWTSIKDRMAKVEEGHKAQLATIDAKFRQLDADLTKSFNALESSATAAAQANSDVLVKIEQRIAAVESTGPEPLDYDKLAAEVLKRTPPIHVIHKDFNTGETIAEKDVPLGGELILKFAPGQPVDARP